MKSIFQKLIPVFFIAIILFTVAVPVFAQSNNPLVPCNGANVPNGPNGGKECTFADLVLLAKGVAAKIFILGLAVAPIIFAYAGFLLLTSQDNPGKRTTAKKIAWNVAIGLVIMMCAWVFVNLILSALVCGEFSASNWKVSTNCAPRSQ